MSIKCMQTCYRTLTYGMFQFDFLISEDLPNQNLSCMEILCISIKCEGEFNDPCYLPMPTSHFENHNANFSPLLPKRPTA